MLKKALSDEPANKEKKIRKLEDTEVDVDALEEGELLSFT